MAEERVKFIYSLSLVFRLGTSLSFPLLIFIAGGVWLDQKLSSSPAYTLAGLGIGMVVSAITFYHELLPLLKMDKKSYNKKPKAETEAEIVPKKDGKASRNLYERQ